jgi:type IX secretion system PorP/SprF family membrane protein
MNRFVAYGTYAYHIQLSEAVNLSAGISAGISQLTVNQNKLELENPADPAVRNYVGNSQADINAGILLYGEQFFAGVSVQQIIQPREETNGNSVDIYGDRKFPDLFISGGFRLNITEDVSLIPSIMLKYINTVPLTFDVNAKVDYKNLFWAGYSYRYKSGMAAMAGAKIKDGIRFGYSYDITTSGLQTVSNGTHEFMLSFNIKHK